MKVKNLINDVMQQHFKTNDDFTYDNIVDALDNYSDKILKYQKSRKLSHNQVKAIKILRLYPNDIIMHDGWLTGGHGVCLPLNTVHSLERKGLIHNQKITELGLTIDLL